MDKKTTHKEPLYEYTKTRKQRSVKFFSMAGMSLLYLLGMYLYEGYYQTTLPDDFRQVAIVVFILAAIILFIIGLWHVMNPAIFWVTVTQSRLTVYYPDSESWSFSVPIKDIKRFEHRQSHAHAGKGISQHGVLMKDGSFHHISMNYDLNLNRLFEEVKKVNPSVSFPKTVNTRYQGFLEKDYRP